VDLDAKLRKRPVQADRFWAERLPRSRKGTRWDQVLFVLVAYRLIAPGAEWRLHRTWYKLKLELPAQPPPKITAPNGRSNTLPVVQTSQVHSR
jgi:hypothetical protein